MVAFGYLNKKMLIFLLFVFKVILHRCNHLTVRVKSLLLFLSNRNINKSAAS